VNEPNDRDRRKASRESTIREAGCVVALLSLLVLVLVPLLTWSDWLNYFFSEMEPYRQIRFTLRADVVAAGILWCVAGIFLFLYWLRSLRPPTDPPP
jgi:hypothetical protein